MSHWVLSQNFEKRLLALSCLSVRPSICTEPLRSQRTDFPWNFIFQYFSKICWEYPSPIKIWHEWRVLYM